MSKLVFRIINALLVVAIIVGYNAIVDKRMEEDSIAYANAMETAREIEESNKEVLSQYGYDEENITEVENNPRLVDGKYKGSALGFGGDIKVEVVVEASEISLINIVSAEKEDDAYFEMAEKIISDIVEKQTTEVDTISGATFSSSGIRDAVRQALEGAYTNE